MLTAVQDLRDKKQVFIPTGKAVQELSTLQSSSHRGVVFSTKMCKDESPVNSSISH